MDIQLICSDIDGTLLDSKGMLSEENILWIRKAWYERHVAFALVSGRFKGGIQPLAKALGIPCFLSCFNGTYISYGTKVLNDTPLSSETILGLLPLVKDKGNTPLVFTLNDWYMESNGYWAEVQRKKCGFNGYFQDLPVLLRQKSPAIRPYKAIIKNLDPRRIDATWQKLQSMHLEDIDCFPSSPQILELVPKGTDKGNTVSILARYLGIGCKNIMAFGDYVNDLGMLRKAAYGIAMANAPEEIKKTAFAVTASNDEAGIAKAIKKYIFQ
jgi:Cof subfamily protein (haloacid dehalogenase superfamily)